MVYWQHNKKIHLMYDKELNKNMKEQGTNTKIETSEVKTVSAEKKCAKGISFGEVTHPQAPQPKAPIVFKGQRVYDVEWEREISRSLKEASDRCEEEKKQQELEEKKERERIERMINARRPYSSNYRKRKQKIDMEEIAKLPLGKALRKEMRAAGYAGI